MTTSLEELFERYRRSGDIDALGEVFDRTAPALTRVAQHLCGPQDASDTVQESYLHAIEAADTWDERRPLTPWLLGILGNRARRHKRAAPRPDPERQYGPKESGDPLATVLQRELDAAVATTIAELPTRYQPVLRLYLLEGRGPAEIAELLSLRPGTVRSQLARGLRAVRRLLPPGLAAGAAPAQTLAGLPGMRATVLAHAGNATGVTGVTGATGATAAPLIIGGLAMKKFGLGVLIAGMFSVLVWFTWREFDPATSGVPQAGGRAGTMPERRAEIDAVAAVPREVAQRVALAPVGEAPADLVDGDAESGRLVVRVSWGRGGPPAVDVPVFVESERRGTPAFAQREAQTDASGVARFVDLPVGRVTVTSGRTEYEPDPAVEIRPGVEATHPLTLQGVTVTGAVVDAADRPVAGAAIIVAAHRPRELARSGADGSFQLGGIGPEVRIGARAAGHAPSPMQRIPPVVQGRPGELRLVLPGPGGVLECTVRDPSGRPLAGALVGLGAGDGRDSEGKNPVGAWRTSTDSAGRARFAGVACGEQQVFAWAPPCAPWRGTVSVEAGTTEFVIELQPGSSLYGQVCDAAGNPLPGCQVAVGRFGSTAYQEFGSFAFQYRSTDAAGAYRIEGLPAGSIAAQVSGGGVSVKQELTAPPGAAVRWDPELAVAASYPGRVLGPDGRGLRAMVEGHSRDGKDWQAFALAGDDGCFTLKNARPGLVVKLTVRVRYFPLTEFEGPLPEPGELLLRVAHTAMPSAHLKGRVVDHHGQPVPMAEVYVVQRGWPNAPGFQAGDGGIFSAGPFPAGEYRLSVEATGRARVVTDWFRLWPDEEYDAGSIRLDPGGRVEVQADSASALPEHLSFPVYKSDGTTAGHVRVVSARGSLGQLAAGRYDLLVRGGGLALARHPFDLEPGGVVELRVAVAPGVPTTVLLGSGERTAPRQVWFELDTADGRRLVAETVRVHEDGRVHLPIALLPGSYRVRVAVAVDGQRLGQRDFAVDPGAKECLVEVGPRGR